MIDQFIAQPVNVKGPLADPDVSAIPWKSAGTSVAKYGSLVFAPYVFFGAAAADFLTGALPLKGEGKSPCLEYEEMRKQENEPATQ